MTSDVHTLRDTDDEGFHEIQLSGKQLVFLCMATTLVSVVIFLCGVLVGRGVKPVEPAAEAAAAPAVAVETPPEPPPSAPEQAATEQAAPKQAAPKQVAAVPPASEDAAADTAPRRDDAAPTPAPSTTPQRAAAAKPVEELSYYDALSKSGPRPASARSEARDAAPRAAEKLPPPIAEPRAAETKPPEAKPADVKNADVKNPDLKDTEPKAAEPVAAETSPADSAARIAVQVAAVANRSDAEAMARRLSGKGYAAYVVTPEPGAKPLFKVRVGNFASSAEAEDVKRRLAREEKLPSWITR